MLEAQARSERSIVQHAAALAWQTRLNVPVGLAWLDQYEYYASMQVAVQALFARENFPAVYTEQELRYERDPLGKPYVTWEGAVEAWARAQGHVCQHLHISNTHDGGGHIVIAAYDPNLVGVGIDAVYLPRLRDANKDANYLRRFASRFMSEREQALFAHASAEDDVERLRLRVAAHFSLMEAASKACGTGLKIGVGMGRPTSLPKQALGVQAMEEVRSDTASRAELLIEGQGLERLHALGAHGWDAYWSADETFLVSVVVLRKQG